MAGSATTPASPPTDRGPGGWWPLEVVVFGVGMATLGAEIAAARLLAPWFGASTIVWANTIATVLVALSAGYALGGRLADRDPTRAGLSRIILISAALLAAVPFVADPFLRLSVRAFDRLSVGTFAGSLIGVLVLVAVPLLLLGMVSPYALRLKLHEVSRAGSTAGRLSAIGTAGSLVGTFAAALLLIPLVGTRRTFVLFALLAVLVALPGLSRRLRPFGALAAALMLALTLLPDGTLKGGTAGDRVLWEKETEYQYARVLQDPSGLRTLELNEGQAVHSVYRRGEWLTGYYYDSLLALSQVSPALARGDARVAVLGNAGGTSARQLGHYFPSARISAVEIDPDVTDAGREFFDMRAPRLTTYDDDARPWLRRTTQRQDVILIDAYRQPYIPFYLTTTEFFSLVRERLAPGGVVAVNVGQVPGSTELERVLAATMRAAFGDGRVFRDPAESTNTMLLGTTTDASPGSVLRERTAALPADLRGVVRAAADRVEPGLRGGTAYTDDRAPVEWLTDLSLAGAATAGG